MDQLWNKYQDYKTQNEIYLKEAYKDGQYYLGNQYTPDELKQLKSRGQAPTIVNYIYSTIYTQMSIMAAKTPTFRALSRDDNDVKKTKLINDVLSYIHDISDGDMQIREAMENMLIFGRGNMGVYYDPLGDDGMGEVKIESIPIDEVYYDPRSKNRFGSDAEYIFRKKRVPLPTALESYPQYADKIHSASTMGASNTTGINNMPSINGTMFGTNDMRIQDGQEVEIIEAYCKKKKIIYRFMAGREMVAEAPQEQVTEVAQQLQQQGVQFDNVLTVRKQFIQYSIMFGQVTAVTYDLPISEYPIIPLVNMWSGNLFPFGDARQLKSLNEEINKMRSLRIHQMATSVNSSLIARKGLFDKESTVETTLARPGSVVFANPISDDISKDLTFVTSGPVPADNYNHENITKSDIQAVSGVYEMQQGGSASAPETFRGILAMDEYGQRKIRYKLKNVEAALGKLGSVALEWAQKAYPVAKTIRIVEPEWNNQEEQARYEKLNVPIFDSYGNMVEKFNDISIGKYDVIVKGGSTMPTNRWAEKQAYLEDYQMGLIDDIEYIKKTDIYDRQSLLERKSLYSQQKQQLDQLSEQIEQLSKENQKLDNDVLRERTDMEVMKARYEEQIRLLKEQMRNENNAGKTANRMEKSFNQFEKKLSEMEIQQKRKQFSSTNK